MSAAPHCLRLFYAAVPDAATRLQIEAAADTLPLDAGAARVARHNLHLTLAFVGDISAVELPALRNIGAALTAPRFALHFDAYEYWPKPEVVVVAARTIPEPLERLWREVHAALAGHQWAQNPKRLRPHVTLARKVVQAPTLPALSAFDWRVREWCLMRADTSGGGAVYTVVDTWSLLDDGENPAKTL
jgi:2'-5' RNA ligase